MQSRKRPSRRSAPGRRDDVKDQVREVSTHRRQNESSNRAERNDEEDGVGPGVAAFTRKDTTKLVEYEAAQPCPGLFTADEGAQR